MVLNWLYQFSRCISHLIFTTIEIFLHFAWRNKKYFAPTMELNYARYEQKIQLRVRQIGDCIGEIFVPWQIFHVIRFAKPVEDTRKLKLKPDARACSSRARSICFTRKCNARRTNPPRSSSFRILVKWRGEYREIMYHAGNRCSCIFCSFCEEKHVLRLNQYPHTLDTVYAYSFASSQYSRSCRSRYRRYFAYKQFS